jgi:hypothetical protein
VKGRRGAAFKLWVGPIFEALLGMLYSIMKAFEIRKPFENRRRAV